jgi:hypothetical protein
MNEWSYISTPPICPHGVDRENFGFYLLFHVNNLKTFERKKIHIFI